MFTVKIKTDSWTTSVGIRFSIEFIRELKIKTYKNGWKATKAQKIKKQQKMSENGNTKISGNIEEIEKGKKKKPKKYQKWNKVQKNVTKTQIQKKAKKVITKNFEFTSWHNWWGWFTDRHTADIRRHTDLFFHSWGNETSRKHESNQSITKVTKKAIIKQKRQTKSTERLKTGKKRSEKAPKRYKMHKKFENKRQKIHTKRQRW